MLAQKVPNVQNERNAEALTAAQTVAVLVAKHLEAADN
jgi:hypothetical protein